MFQTFWPELLVNSPGQSVQGQSTFFSFCELFESLMIEVAKTKLRNLVPSLPLNTVEVQPMAANHWGGGGSVGARGGEG